MAPVDRKIGPIGIDRARKKSVTEFIVLVPSAWSNSGKDLCGQVPRAAHNADADSFAPVCQYTHNS